MQPSFQTTRILFVPFYIYTHVMSVQQVMHELGNKNAYLAVTPVEFPEHDKRLLAATQKPFNATLFPNVDLGRVLLPTTIRNLEGLCVDSSASIDDCLATLGFVSSLRQNVGSGSAATTFTLPYWRVKKFQKELDSFMSETLISSQYSPPQLDTRVLVKATKLRNKRLLHGSIREAMVHREVAEAHVPKTDWLPAIAGSDVVPHFYSAFALAARGTPVFVVIMEYVQGLTLTQYMEQQRRYYGGHSRIGRHLFANVERAVKSLWCLGYTHSDMHHNNILVASNDSVRLIDLAVAVPLHREVSARVRVLMTPWTDIAALYFDNYLGIQSHNKHVIALRSLEAYFAEARLLCALRRKIPVDVMTDLQSFQIVRMKSWWSHANVEQFRILASATSSTRTQWTRMLHG